MVECRQGVQTHTSWLFSAQHPPEAARGARINLAASSSGFTLLGALNFINPDALIARTNIARADAGRPVDVSYLKSLSADAVPAILSRVSSLDIEDRCELLRILAEGQAYHRTDWRSWNLGRFRAALANSERRFADKTVLFGRFADRWWAPHCIAVKGSGLFYTLFRKVCTGGIVPPNSRRTSFS